MAQTTTDILSAETTPVCCVVEIAALGFGQSGFALVVSGHGGGRDGRIVQAAASQFLVPKRLIVPHGPTSMEEDIDHGNQLETFSYLMQNLSESLTVIHVSRALFMRG